MVTGNLRRARDGERCRAVRATRIAGRQAGTSTRLACRISELVIDSRDPERLAGAGPGLGEQGQPAGAQQSSQRPPQGDRDAADPGACPAARSSNLVDAGGGVGYFGSRAQQAMLNFRVRDLDAKQVCAETGMPSRVIAAAISATEPPGPARPGQGGRAARLARHRSSD